MTIGLTYAYGRTDADTIESDTVITRVAGQFTSPFTSCPVRASGTHRLRLPVTSSQVTATSGAVIVYFDPDNAYNAGGQDANGRIVSWYLSAAERIELEFTKSGSLYTARRLTGSAGATITVASGNFAAGDATCVLIAWDASTLKVAVNAGTIQSVANASTPTGLPTTLDIGSLAAASYMDAAYGAVVMLSAPPTQAQWEALAGLRALRPPLYGEGVGAVMTQLWYGANSRVWTLGTGGTAVDFYAQTGVRVYGVDGMGVPPMEHRNAETPLRDGASYVDSRMRPRTVSIPLSVFGASMALWQAARRVLLAGLNPRLGQGVLMYAPDVQCYEVDAVVNGGLGFDHEIWNMYQRPTPQFICFDPAIRTMALVEDLATVALSGWTIPWSLPWSLSNNADISSVTNSGDIDTWPQLQFTAGVGGATAPFFTNSTTGKTVSFSAGVGLEMAEGDVLLVDMGARTATVSGVNVMAYRSDASRMWPLIPGANSINIGAETGQGTGRTRAYAQLIGV